MSPRTTAAIAQELQRDDLLSLELLTTAMTVLTLHASHHHGDTPRICEVFEQLVEVIHQAETDLAVFDLP